MNKTKQRKVMMGVAAAMALITGVVLSTRQAFAYTVNNNLTAYSEFYQAYGTTSMAPIGNQVHINTAPAGWSQLTGSTVRIASECAWVGNMSETPDGQGNWGIMHADMEGSSTSNGYLIVADPAMGSSNVSSWVSRLGGNLTFVQRQLQGNQITTVNKSTNSSYTYDPFALVVSKSGSEFGAMTLSPTGQTYNGNPVVSETYPIYTSNPPQATGLSVTDAFNGGTAITQGDQINISAKSTVWLWSQLASYHYDAVQFRNNSTGASYWAVGSSSTDNSSMQPVSGGHGYFTDNLTSKVSSSSLPLGSYTATFWVADGVDRVSSIAATANFTIGSGSSGTGPTLNLSANPFSLPVNQSSTLTATGTNIPSTDTIEIEDMSAASTLGGSDMAYSSTGQSSYSTSSMSATAQTVTYEAKAVNQSTGQVDAISPTVQVTWTSSSGGGITSTGSPPSITFNPLSNVSVATGTPVNLSYNTSGWQAGDHVQIMGTGTGTGDLWNVNSDTSTSDSATETENPTNGQTAVASYVAYLYNGNGQLLAQANSGQIQWISSSPPPTTTIEMAGNPPSASSGAPITVWYSVSNWQSGDYVKVSGYGGTSMWSTSADTLQYDSHIEQEYPQNGATTTVNYTATVYNASGQAVASATTTVTWGSQAPTISMSASPTHAKSGQSVGLSYTVTNEGIGDYVTVTGTGGSNMWSQPDDTNASDSFSEVENPENGATTTVTYTATLHNSSGGTVGTATITVTWTSQVPTISVSANPTNLVSGQPTELSYSVTNMQTGDYVDVVPSGSGTNMWSASNQTQSIETSSEIEDPAAGQTIKVSYTATLYDQSGTALGVATTSASWSNAWTGSISLSASPVTLPTGQATTLSVSTTTAIPSGYNVYIEDTTTGQVIAQTGAAPFSITYTSYTAETDQFVAYVNDGFVNLGSSSNTVSVTWSDLSLAANPLQVSIGQPTTLTVTGENVPAGDYLVLENQSTGQVIGYSQSTPYTVQQTETTAQTDTYVAYISSSTSTTGAFVTSNTVSVTWYSLTLRAVPSRLPINDTSTLTATAQNLPSGYVIDIVDQTTNQTIATGQPGETQVQALQTKTQAETDDYIAQILQPGNPAIPGMSIPASPGGLAETSRLFTAGPSYGIAIGSGEVYATSVGNNYNGSQHTVYIFNATTNTFVKSVTAGTSNLDPQDVAYGNGYFFVLDNSSDGVEVFSASSNSLLRKISGLGSMPGYVTYGSNGNLYVSSMPTSGSGFTVYVISTSTWSITKTISYPSNGSWPGGIAYDPTNGYVYVTTSGSTEVAVINPTTSAVMTQIPVGSSTGSDRGLIYANGKIFVTNNGNGTVSVIDPTTNTLTATITLPTGSAPLGITYGNGDVFTANTNGTVSMIDPTSYAVLTTIAVGKEPWKITAGGGYVYVTDMNVASDPTNNYTMDAALWVLSQSGSVGTAYMPFWTFQSLPSYIPTSLFTQAAVASSISGDIWLTGGSTAANGTGFFEGNFSLPSSQSVTFQIQPTQVNDYQQVYVDGQLLLQYGANGEATSIGSAVPNQTQATITLPAGQHQVLIEGLNDNAYASSSPNSAGVNLSVIANGSTLLSTGTASQWMTTGYITQLPAGWFSGAVGTWSWNEYIVQEQTTQPIYQQQSFSVSNTAQSVSTQSSVVPVTWYNPVVPPDNFTLQALPTEVTAPANTQFNVTFDQSDANFVNESLGGSATVKIVTVQTWQPAVQTTWTPNTDGLSISKPYTPVAGSQLQYIALLEDQQGVIVAISNQVTVTDTGLGMTGNSYSTATCSGTGDGTEVFNTYVNGTLSSTKTVPLTLANLEVDGIFNATSQLQQEYPGTTVHLPVTNALLGNAPIPLRVQAPFAFAVQFPDAQPTRVVAVFSVNGGPSAGTVDEQGDSSWTVQMHPATNLPLYWQGETIMPKLPDGVNISVTIKAYDDCGEQDLTNNDFLVTSGRPQFYFVQPSKP